MGGGHVGRPTDLGGHFRGERLRGTPPAGGPPNPPSEPSASPSAGRPPIPNAHRRSAPRCPSAPGPGPNRDRPHPDRAGRPRPDRLGELRDGPLRPTISPPQATADTAHQQGRPVPLDPSRSIVALSRERHPARSRRRPDAAGSTARERRREPHPNGAHPVARIPPRVGPAGPCPVPRPGHSWPGTRRDQLVPPPDAAIDTPPSSAAPPTPRLARRRPARRRPAADGCPRPAPPTTNGRHSTTDPRGKPIAAGGGPGPHGTPRHGHYPRKARDDPTRHLGEFGLTPRTDPTRENGRRPRPVGRRSVGRDRPDRGRARPGAWSSVPLPESTWPATTVYPVGTAKAPDRTRPPTRRRDDGPPQKWRAIVLRNPGGVLLSQGASPQVPSALASLTAVFGMGTGVSPPPWPPEILRSAAAITGPRGRANGGSRGAAIRSP